MYLPAAAREARTAVTQNKDRLIEDDSGIAFSFLFYVVARTFGVTDCVPTHSPCDGSRMPRAGGRRTRAPRTRRSPARWEAGSSPPSSPADGVTETSNLTATLHECQTATLHVMIHDAAFSRTREAKTLVHVRRLPQSECATSQEQRLQCEAHPGGGSRLSRTS